MRLFQARPPLRLPAALSIGPPSDAAPDAASASWQGKAVNVLDGPVLDAAALDGPFARVRQHLKR